MGAQLGRCLGRLQARFGNASRLAASPTEESPLRSELFSADQMEQHGKALALSHRLAAGRAPDRLLARLAANENALVSVCELLTATVTAKRRITPAGEWLLDNFYLIEEQIRLARRHLPKGYSRELPRLEQGASSGRPRVYDIALETIAHGDGRVDAQNFSRFVRAYQTVTELQLGELWAIPIMLRLAVIENLRRVGVRIAAGWKERNLAASWADQMTDVAEKDPKSLILVVADMARSNPPMVGAFVAELARRLQGRGPTLALPLTWIEQRLSESGLTIERLVQWESQQQAADQVSISNSIGSLRVLGTTDWRKFVEAMSVVEQALQDDPAGVYGKMDFATRDRYRHATERLAKQSRRAENEVARRAVDLARTVASSDADAAIGDPAAHVGYYLVDQGLPQLERLLVVRQSRWLALRRSAARYSLFAYLSGIAVITATIGASLLTRLAPRLLGAGVPAGAMPLLALLIGLLLLPAASQLAVALVNWLATLLATPRPLPRMDLSTGIPPELRTLVVVPTMLSSAAGAEDLVEALEVRFLANREANLHFALLTDFPDAQSQSLASDWPLLTLLQTRIAALNSKYAGGEGGRRDSFFLFHRPRLWNAQDRVWMGYERKRGKLADLNALLRAADAGSRFSLIVGDTARLTTVKYVITLDTDTQLPRDAARQFVGAMAHPLNRPRYDEQLRRIVAGYGILQPRVAISLPGSSRSRYARLYAGEPGIDPYTRVVSDVYQDLFAEGSFIGKGIYAVDAFERVLGDRLPDNRVLSHDLLEGCYARAGLLSDVQLYEDYPASYAADVSRRQRWIRGDWQLAGWLWSRVPAKANAARADQDEHNPLSVLSQWKLIDNLRRSLVPTALLLMLLAGWTIFADPWFWTLAVIGIVAIPSLCVLLLELSRQPEDVMLRQHLAACAHSASRRLVQVLFELACLPYEVCFSLDAIGRTVWRMRVTRRNLLDWTTSGELATRALAAGHSDLYAAFRSMWVAPAIAATTTIYLALTTPTSLLPAAALLALWLASPAIAWWVSRPLAQRQAALSPAQILFLLSLSRRTWGFFETFVGAEDHWLPPDNYQEYRLAAAAHRTSPTNMGLALLANLAAYDFGYIGSGQLLARTANTLGTMAGLQKHRGHFYNWYDTLSLQPLPPLYISTVDSGNLAGHLLTLRAGLLALGDDSVVRQRLFEGLADTLGLVDEGSGADGALAERLAEFSKALGAATLSPPHSLAAARLILAQLSRSAEAILALVDSEAAAPQSETQRWALALTQQLGAAQEELALFAPGPSSIAAAVDSAAGVASAATIPSLRQLARAANPHARERIEAIEALAAQAFALARMEYGFLFDTTRQLLTIGYNVDERRADLGYYDLLASEARLCTFVAIAQGELPQESWFSLGRLLTSSGGEPVLLSWSGSMFEYLMPLLVMPTYDETLLDQTCKAAVARQIEYGGQRGVAWGISESGYNTVDLHLNYQYRAFGVPGLGLKRGLAEDLVIAPYASVLALMVAPEAACANLQKLAAEGLLGRFGLFEAIDHTPARQKGDRLSAVVRSFMAHHQGMSLLALAYLLLDRPMQRRFESEPLFQAVMLLLQEKIPKAVTLFAHTAQLSESRAGGDGDEGSSRLFNTPDTPIPEVQLLSNGRYHVMVSNAGGGYSRWKDLAVNRWREDGTCDNWGNFCYLRELRTGGADAAGPCWSIAHQPTLQPATSYEAIFSEGRAEFRRCDAVASGEGSFETHTEIVVSPEDDIELRRVRITNRSRQRRQIELTSFAEVVIAPAAADSLHPAFSNLFVQTEVLAERSAILCTRRPRSLGEQSPWMLHLMVARGAKIDDLSYETDRCRFIGRSRSSAAPLALTVAGALSGSAGSVLDPIVAIRHTLTLEPEQATTVDLVFGMADTREAALALIDKYQDRHLTDRVLELAWTHSQVVLRQLNASDADAQLYARLAGAVIYVNAAMRAEAALIVKNRRGQSALWGYAISGDLPIVLLQIGDAANIDLVRQVVQAHAYWRLKGLAVDLVIWNEDRAGYRQQLQERIIGMITSGVEASVIDRPGGIFVRPAEQISAEDRTLFQAVARAVIRDDRGSLAEQLDRRARAEPLLPEFTARRSRKSEDAAALAPPPRELILGNGLGGFTADGKEYVIALAPGQATPAPWVNVLANPQFGSVVSESGGAYTWSENAHEFRLTPWHNDPVSDGSGECIYLRDEDSGQAWSPTPLPMPAAAPYTIRHGFGYSVFETRAEGIASELWVYVATDAAVKFSLLKLRNLSGRTRQLTATAYVEWVLGDLPQKAAMHLATEVDAQSGALYARNPYNTAFAGRVAFLDVDDEKRRVCGDRREFVGRNGSLRKPAALRRARLSGKVGAGLDPCGAIQVRLELAAGQEREVVFRLGLGANADEAGALVRRFRGTMAARGALEAVWQQWNRTLGAVQVDTPDPALNVLANGWLVYQTLACRLWARSGYYQSGGAFGFRDQLQDAMALIHTEPALLRQQLLLCASRQFAEGDVQHWWHPPAGRGVRTRCSDDYLWLPLAVCRYVTASGDTGVLDERLHFLEGRPVNAEDDSYYDLPGRSSAEASLYQHCVLAIEHGLRFGAHGLPLIGSGDWNDGMNLVGIGGKGESVWLGFFLCEVLQLFGDLARARADAAVAERCRDQEQRLRRSIEAHGWDGEWYRRAYFDDGTPLGSAANAECQIDSIAQSWSVLSAAGDRSRPSERERQAMAALEQRLVRREDGLVQLLAPPFDQSALNPGYIRGYVPGVRENGGQYTHAALWAAMAFAELGERERAWELASMINPVNHGLSAQAIATYKVEPYVMAADVYAVAPHTGRGGWTWYSGSAGWMYRLLTESLLGLRLEGQTLRLAPCLPAHWQGFKLHYRYRETVYHLDVVQVPGEGARGVRRLLVDGVDILDKAIPLIDDRREHSVELSVR